MTDKNNESYVIKASEIEDFFDIKTSNIIDKIFYNLKENCELGCHGILKKPDFFAQSDFHELIKYNSDIEAYFKKKNKIDN